MVSRESVTGSHSSGVHQFIISDSITNQNRFEQHDYPNIQSQGRDRNLTSQSPSMLPSIQSLGQRFSRSVELLQNHSLSEDSQNCTRRHLMNLFKATNETDSQGQRLSLTLGSHVPSHMMVQPRVNHDEHTRDDAFNNASSSTSQNQSCSSSYETEHFASTVGNSRYLKPAQSLLEEVVSVGGDGDANYIHKGMGLSPELRAELYSTEFSSTEDHGVQTRITKLVTLLNEVESRYEQYHHQMEEVVSSFEMIAGLGAATSYTAQALQAMSRHFCSLRNSIITQIRISKRHLSQDLQRARGGVSQLSLFDQVTRNRDMALQQLGMIQNRQAWRPARGLPENSVGILRSWLFKNFLHPYPNDSEKLMLASQTGLNKNQVSNWFINARVRLWKPMIEDMYKEEVAESSMDSTHPENTSTGGESNSDHAGN